MTKRFSVNGNLDVDDKCLKIATFLDPRFKEKFLKDKEQVMETIISELIDDDETDQPAPPVELTLSQDKEQNSDVSLDEEIHTDFWSCFNEIKEVGSDGDDPDTPCSTR